MTSLFPALLFYGLAVVVNGLFGWGSGLVTELTDKTFASHLKSNPRTLVKFHAPWCGHCKELAPKFKEAATQLESRGVSLAKLDATAHPEAAKPYAIESYPTLLWLEEGGRIDYTGNQTTEGIVEFVTKLTAPAVTEVATMEALPDIGTKVPRVVLRAPSLLDGFAEAAKSNRTQGAWHFVPDSAGSPRVILQHRGEEAFELAEKVGDAAAVTAFFNEHAIPLFGRLDKDTFARYGDGQGLIWTLFPNPKKKDGGFDALEAELRPTMLKVARKYIGTYRVAIADTTEFKENVERMLSVKKFPAIVVQPKAGSKMKFLHMGDMSATTIIQFIDAVDHGTVPPHIKSQPAPLSNNALIKVLVGTTVKEEAFTPDRDVMVEIYAEWCGACKAFYPEYEKLAKYVRGRKLHDLVTIAKIDGAENDMLVSAFEYKSFPTLYFVPAGSDEPIQYDGEREAKAMWKWITQRSGKAEELKARRKELKGKKEEL